MSEIDVLNKKNSRNGNRQFAVVVPKIIELMNNNYTKIEIYNQLKNELNFGYKEFALKIRKLKKLNSAVNLNLNLPVQNLGVPQKSVSLQKPIINEIPQSEAQPRAVIESLRPLSPESKKLMEEFQ